MSATATQTNDIATRLRVNQAFMPLLDARERFLILFGGAGSGKSVFAAQKILVRTMTEPGHRIVCTRKVARTIKDSVWALFKDTLLDAGLLSQFTLNKTEMRLRFNGNGNEIFCLGLDDPEKIKSIAGITGYWHEETTELAPIDLDQLDLRLRGETAHYKQHILTFNPISARHWLRKRYVEAGLAYVRTHHSTYQDNAFLDDEYRQRLDALIGNMQTVYRDGEWGVLEGAIYTPFIVDACPVSVPFDDRFYGLDFGFNNPTALVEINLADRELYLTETIYETGMTNSDLIARMTLLGVPKNVPIYADAASPDRITEIRRAGWNIRGAPKGQGSVNAGISFVQGLRIHTKPSNENINHENLTYAWRIDKDGNPMDEPEKENDHAMDALRYAVFAHIGKNWREVASTGAFDGVGVF